MAYENSKSNRHENVLQQGRVVYIEPNSLTERKIYNPEDYSMFVDLMVETTDRYTRKKTEVEVRWTGESLVFSGSRIASTERKYLSTDILNTTYYDVKEGHNDEGLCIESIDIAYNSWNFPEVNIKFTDVRGVSLLSPSDYFHHKDTDVESGGDKIKIVKKNEDRGSFTDSFVSSFFRFPYPRYRLKVKGFYGRDVTYQLCVSDFRTAFNSNTGNFDINVKFIGYMYGFFTDIPINYLFGAPYTPGRDGAGYWDEQDFTFETGEKIPKFAVLEKRLQDINKNLEQNSEYRKIQTLKEEIQKENEAISNLKAGYKDFLDSFAVKEVVTGVESPVGEDGTTNSEEKWYMLLVPIEQVPQIADISVEDDLISVSESLKESPVLPDDYLRGVDSLCKYNNIGEEYSEISYLNDIITSLRKHYETSNKRGKENGLAHEI